MAHLYSKTRYRKQSKLGSRFYTMLDMAIIKHDSAVRNAMINRGKIKNKPNHYIAECGCGVEGCFLEGAYDNKR